MDFTQDLINSPVKPNFLQDTTPDHRGDTTPVNMPREDNVDTGADQIEGNFNKLFSTPDPKSNMQPVTFNWDESSADHYVHSPQAAQTPFDPRIGALNEENFATTQPTWDKVKNTMEGWGAGVWHGFIDQAASWKNTMSVFQDPTLQSAFHQDELEEIAKKNKDFENKYPIYQSKYDQDHFFSWDNFYKQVQSTGPLTGSIAEMAVENIAATALIAGTGGLATGVVASTEGLRDASLIASSTKNAIKEGQILSRTVDNAANVKKTFSAFQESPTVTNALKSAGAWTGANIVKPAGEGLSALSNLLPGSNTAKFLAQGIEDVGVGTADITRSKAIVNTVTKGVGSAYADLRDLNLSVSMAQGNASGTYFSMLNEWKQKFKDENGRDPNAIESQEIQDHALKAAKTNGALDAMVMLYTNKLAFGNLLKGSKAVEEVIAQQGSGEFLKKIGITPEFLMKEDGDKLFLKSKWFSWKSALNAAPELIGHGLGFSLTVSGSKVVDDMARSYFEAKYNNKDISWADAYKDGIDKQFSKEGAQTFISSFLTGVLVPGLIGEKLGHIKDNADMIYNREGYKARTADEQLRMNEFVSKFNNFYKDPTSPIRENLSKLNEQSGFKAWIDLAVTLKNTKLFNDLHDDALRSFMIPAIRNDMSDLYINHLKDFTDNLSTQELFEKIHPDLKYEGNEDLAKAFQSHIIELQGRTQDMAKIYKDLYRKFPNPHNPYKYKVDSPERVQAQENYTGYQHAIDMAVYNKDIVQRDLERQGEVLNGKGDDKGIRGMDAFKNLSFSTLYNFTDNEYLKGALETLRAEATAETNGTKKKGLESLIEAHEDYNLLLNSYKNDYKDVLKITDPTKQAGEEKKLDEKYSKAFEEPFGQIVQNELKEKGKILTPSEEEEAVHKYLDYYKLGVRSNGQLLFSNVITDPHGNWGEYTKAVIKAYKDHQEEQRKQEEETPQEQPGELLKEQSFEELRQKEAKKQKLEREYNIQKTHFEELIKDTESKLSEIEERKSLNEEEFQKHLKDIDDFKEKLTGNKDIFEKERLRLEKLKDSYKGKSFERTGEFRQFKKFTEAFKIRQHEISQKIDRYQQTLDFITREREELDRQVDTLKQAKEFQQDFLHSLEGRDEAFNKEDTRSLIDRLEDKKNKLGTNEVPQHVDKLLDDLREEITTLKGRESLLTDVIKSGREFLSKVSGLEDIYNTLLEKVKDGDLKKYLWDIRNGLSASGESTPEMVSIAKELLKIPSDEDTSFGIQKAYIHEIIKRTAEAEKEIEDLSKRKQNLIEKEEQLSITKDQDVERTSLGDRIDYLKKISDALDSIPIEVFEAPSPKTWDVEKQAFQEENKPFWTDQEVDNTGEFFSTPIERFSKPVFHDEVFNRWVGRQFEPEHLNIDGKKFEIDRQDKDNIKIKVLDKAKYTPKEVEETQNLAKYIQLKPSELLDLDHAKDTEYNYNGDILKVTRYDNDTILNTDEKNAEAYALSAEIPISDVNLSVITADNDTYNIRNTQAYSDDIKVIAVDPTTKEPIGLDGKVISNPTKDNIIYRSLQGSEELLDHTNLPAQLLDPKGLKGKAASEAQLDINKFQDSKVFKSISRLFYIPDHKNETIIRVFNSIKGFKALREALKDEVVQNKVAYLEVVDKSQGIPNELPKKNGEVQKHPIEGSILKEGTDWVHPTAPNDMAIELKIANSSDLTTQGIKSGRLVFIREDNQKFPVDNRPLSQDEHHNIINALKFYSNHYNKTDDQLEQEYGETQGARISGNMSKARKLLNSMLFWGPPSESDHKSQDPNKIGKNRLYLLDDVLYRTSKDGISKVFFSESELDKPQNQEILLNRLFHQVNKKILEKNDTYDNYIFSDKGEVSSEPYDSYLHYLATKEDEEGVSVIHTNIIKHTTPEENKPNSLNTTLKQVALQFRDDYGYTPTPQQIEREEEPKNLIELPETKQIESEVPDSLFPIMEEEVMDPEGEMEEIKPGILRHTIETPNGNLVFHSFENELIRQGEGFNEYAPKLIREVETIESNQDAKEPLITSEPQVPEEPPHEEESEPTRFWEDEGPFGVNTEPENKQEPEISEKKDVSLLEGMDFSWMTDEQRKQMEEGMNCDDKIGF